MATALGAWLYQRGQETRDAEARVAKFNWPRMMLAGLVFGLVAPLLTEPVAMLGIGYGDAETGFLSLEAIDKLALSDL